VLIDLAKHMEDGYIPLKEIASRQGISKKYMENILKVLVENKLLEGIKGKGGGYRLTMPPEQYSLGTILRLTEGSLAPTACAAPEHAVVLPEPLQLRHQQVAFPQDVINQGAVHGTLKLSPRLLLHIYVTLADALLVPRNMYLPIRVLFTGGYTDIPFATHHSIRRGNPKYNNPLQKCLCCFNQIPMSGIS